MTFCRPPCIQRYVANAACLNYRHLIAASLGIVPAVETVSFTGRCKQCYFIALNRERRYSAVCIRAAVEYIAYRVFNGIPLCRELDICRNCRIEVVSCFSNVPTCECIAVLSRSLGRRDFFAVVYGYFLHRTAAVRIEAYGVGIDDPLRRYCDVFGYFGFIELKFCFADIPTCEFIAVLFRRAFRHCCLVAMGYRLRLYLTSAVCI